MPFVLDACAMIAYLQGEKGSSLVRQLLLDEDCMAHAVNLCEVFYDYLLRGKDEIVASSAIDDLISLELIIRDDMDREFWQMVASYKSLLRVSLADCFTISLANRIKATLVTSDHHEFDSIFDRGFLPYGVMFIR
jgi:PIN domain nuclease of toxin-antitoxin system